MRVAEDLEYAPFSDSEPLKLLEHRWRERFGEFQIRGLYPRPEHARMLLWPALLSALGAWWLSPLLWWLVGFVLWAAWRVWSKAQALANAEALYRQEREALLEQLNLPTPPPGAATA